MARVPEEATATMRATARMLRDMFIALQNEGFTEGQALMLLGATIAASIQAAPKDEKET